MRPAARLLLFMAVLAGGLLAACGAGDDSPDGAGLRLTDAWARPAAAGDASAVYLTIANDGMADALTSVECPIAAECMLHETTIAGDVVHMQHLARLEIPAGGQVTLEPGGIHIMLMGLEHELAVRDRVAITLRFENAGDMPVEAEVLAP